MYRFTHAAAAVTMALLLATSGGAGFTSPAATTGTDGVQAFERTQDGNGTADGNASISFPNQTTDGATVMVESVTLPEGGFVEVTNENGVVVGQSGYLDPGSHQEVNVTLDENVSANQSMTAFAIRDATDNQEFDGTGPGNETDAVYTAAAGDAVAERAVIRLADARQPGAAGNRTNVTDDNVTADNVTDGNVTEGNATEDNETNVTTDNVTADNATADNVTADNETNVTNATNATGNVTNATAGNVTNATAGNATNATAGNETAATANVTFENQSSNGTTVVVERAVVPRGGFVVVHTDAILDGADAESVRGVSDSLDPGTHRNVTVRLDEPITDSQRLVAVAYRDTDGDGSFAFYEQNRTVDAPYFRDGNVVVSDVAFVTVEQANATADGGNATAGGGNASA